MRQSIDLLSVYQSRDHVCPLLVSLEKLLIWSKPRTPETFDIVTNTVDIGSRKNLAQISKVLTQTTNGIEFGAESPSYIPINEFVGEAIERFTAWILEGTLCLHWLHFLAHPGGCSG
jgi:hypothetical protein